VSKKKLTEMQTLILWALLANGGEGFQKNIKPEAKKADRKALEKEGLITCETRGRYRSIWFETSDKGWAWATDHLDADLPNGSTAGSAVLQAWLTLLQAFMNARNVTLAEILGPQPETKLDASRDSGDSKSSEPSDYSALSARVRAAYLELTIGHFNKRALLSDLRAKLKDIDRSALDEVLKRMQREQDASLMPLDNRIDITDADRAAAIYFGHEPRHILWIVR
jgi:hypothetical protein